MLSSESSSIYQCCWRGIDVGTVINITAELCLCLDVMFQSVLLTDSLNFYGSSLQRSSVSMTLGFLKNACFIKASELWNVSHREPKGLSVSFVWVCHVC